MSSPASASVEERAQEEMARLDAYRSQLNAMLSQLQMLQSSRMDHERAQRSLDGIERAEAGREFLIPLGGETYVRGTVQRGTPVLIGIGSGVTVELPREQVVETLAQRITRIDAATRELEGQIRTFEDRIQWLSQRLEALARGEPVPPGTADSDVGGNLVPTPSFPRGTRGPGVGQFLRSGRTAAGRAAGPLGGSVHR